MSRVRARGADRIEFEFWYRRKRYRPTLRREPTDANLRRAQLQLERIHHAIAAGTFNFLEEFPDYRLPSRLPPPPQGRASAACWSYDPSVLAAQPVTCHEVFERFLAQAQTRVALGDLAHSTCDSYRQLLRSVWTPRIGARVFLEVRYSELLSILAAYAANAEQAHAGSRARRSGGPLAKKTYNNVASVVRSAFEYGYNDHLDLPNPALRLKTLRVRKKDKRPIDPFTLEEGELIIARSHQAFGEAHGNYEEFRFFTGLRPSEQFALTLTDFDRAAGTLAVRRACVRGRDKDRTKTHEDRQIQLCERARGVLERQLALRARLVAKRRIRHECLFFQARGAPLRDLAYPSRRWRRVLTATGIRYRDPYHARHSFISWSLMAGANLLKLAQENGHSLHTMLSTYAAWLSGATETDVLAIRQAMAHAATMPEACATAHASTSSLAPRGDSSTAKPSGRLSMRNCRGSQRGACSGATATPAAARPDSQRSLDVQCDVSTRCAGAEANCVSMASRTPGPQRSDEACDDPVPESV